MYVYTCSLHDIAMTNSGLNSKTGGGGGGPCIAQYGAHNTTGRGAIKEVLKAKNSID